MPIQVVVTIERGDDMKKEQQRLATRTGRRNNHKMDKILNILIGLVSVGIVIALIVIFTTDEPVPEQAEPIEKPIDEQANPEPAPETETALKPEQPAKDADIETTEEENVEQSPSTASENTVTDSAQAGVKEVWTNEAWTPYPTAQTGAHSSTYEIGHIDYEEKLKAFYSVIPLEQDNSIVWSAKNNGSATTAIAVISSNDKSEVYQVAIEWLDGEGWLPVQVEVLTTLP